ncbi:MAG: bacterial Ig-like domain-containing protein [Sphaerochaeta sp.]|jgi:hypothetical protein|nr:bacterial Ig-like domain-containing protein [Sphaerochaeta sp.]
MSGTGTSENKTITVSYGGQRNTTSVTVHQTVTSISLKSAPTKTTYYAGDTLELNGLAITLHYSNTTTEDLAWNATGVTVSPNNGSTLNTTGSQTITVSYEEVNVTTTVTVNAVVVSSIASVTAPTTAYDAGTTINVSDLTVTANLNNESQRTLSASELSFSSDSSTATHLFPTDESENGNWTKDLTVYYVDGDNISTTITGTATVNTVKVVDETGYMSTLTSQLAGMTAVNTGAYWYSIDGWTGADPTSVSIGGGTARSSTETYPLSASLGAATTDSSSASTFTGGTGKYWEYSGGTLNIALPQLLIATNDNGYVDVVVGDKKARIKFYTPGSGLSFVSKYPKMMGTTTGGARDLDDSTYVGGSITGSGTTSLGVTTTKGSVYPLKEGDGPFQ